MTTSLIIAVAVVWAVAIAGLYAASRRGARKRRARREPVIVAFARQLTNAEMEAFKAEWLRKYGHAGAAHHVKPLDEENPDA